MSESPEKQQQKKTSKTKAFKKGISKLVKSPKKSHPGTTTFDGSSGSGSGSATLGHGYRTGQNKNQDGILKRSRSLNQIDTKDDDDTESLNSAATISVFRSVHFDSTKNLEEGRISDAGWASSKASTSNGNVVPPQVIVHDSDYIQPNAIPGQQYGSSDHVSRGHRSATLPRNVKLRSFSDSSEDKNESIDNGRSERQDQFKRSQSTPSARELDNLGVIKLVASSQNIASSPVSTPQTVTTVPIQSPQQDLQRVQGIPPVQLKELEERIERKVRRTVDKILRKQRETGAPSLSGTNQKLTVWECMVLEIQRVMETLYIEKVQKERHLIRKEIIKKLEAEKPPTQESETQANLTVVEARPFIQPLEVKHTDFVSQTDAIPEPELSILKTQTDDVSQYNISSQTRELEEIGIIESLKARLQNLQTDYDHLRRQYNSKLEEMEEIRMEISTYNRPTSNLVTITEETPTYTSGTQTKELTETDIIRNLQKRLFDLEKEHSRIEILYEEKVTEINTLTLEFQQNIMNLEGQIKQVPNTSNVKVQVSPDAYDSGIQTYVKTSDLWTYTDAGKQYPDSSDLQIQVNKVTRDEGSSTIETPRFNIGVQCSPATKDASDSTILSLSDLEEIEEFASLYHQREQTEIVTKTVRSETPELPDNTLFLKYLETSGNRSDDVVTAAGVLLKSDKPHTVSLESMRYMDVETSTDQSSGESSGYYSNMIDRNGLGESSHTMSSLKFTSLQDTRQADTNYGNNNGNGYFSNRDMNGDSRQHNPSMSGTYLFDTERRTTKLTSTPQSEDHDYSFEVSTSSMGRPSFGSNVSASSDRPRRFLKYGVTGQQYHPVVDLRSPTYVPGP
ncbi:uncharacterized protein [Antedon mediterranea]|uniref:uncharacterized protein n=1 Tax=Antedon mediterranea TaxID=105859 RepID=UPI003AF5B2CC